tara:strand:- start:10832 stop:11269 length:438 start_codon:yes stop_codon:yes gene_type:complete
MKTTIGRIDKGDFPELELSDIDIKIDSGAYTSSIHCANIEEIRVNNIKFIKFTLLDSEHPLYNNKVFSSKNYTTKVVKSSNGATEERFAVKTEIILFNKTLAIDLTLSERSDMKFPVLIGRKFLNKQFIIDSSRTNLSHKLKIKQ